MYKTCRRPDPQPPPGCAVCPPSAPPPPGTCRSGWPGHAAGLPAESQPRSGPTGSGTERPAAAA